MERLHVTRRSACHHTRKYRGDSSHARCAHASLSWLRMIYWRRAERTPVTLTLHTSPAASAYIERDHPDVAANLFAIRTYA